MSFVSALQLARFLPGAGWQGLTDACLQNLAKLAAIQSFSQDDVLPEGTYIVSEGLIGVMRGADADRRAVTALYLVGDLVDLQPGPFDHLDRLVALRPTRAVFFPAEGFTAAMQRHQELALIACANLKRQSFNLREHAAELYIKAPDQRLAAFLLWLEQVSGVADAHLGFDLPMRRYDLARYLGMQPETLSRKIKALVSEGAISQRSPSRLVIESRSALETLAAGLRRVA